MKSADLLNRNLVIYSVYVRNHTQEGTFRALEGDLERIRNLGVDVIWLMPIHPIGEKGKKGALGCPYSVSDYRAVNPAYGSMADFRHLVEAIHSSGMKCIIDVVYNHTSKDSVLVAQHPDFYYRKPDGSMGNRFADWTDVNDLDYSSKELWEYQVETLRFWAEIVDGFRCDVASCVPLDFWLYARSEVEKVRQGCFWLAETVETSMISYERKQGFGVASDAEMYQAFDAEYQYDIFDRFRNCFTEREREEAVAGFVEALNLQECIYPSDYMKLRFLENHDNNRFAALCPDPEKRLQWLDFLFFLKGPVLIYAGQEFSCSRTPSLFDKDVFDRTGENISTRIAELSRMKKTLPTDAFFEARVLSSTDRGVEVEADYIKGGQVCRQDRFLL